jgi:pseudaminic acid cytidylyltransferase
MANLAIIPARGGSKRVPRKNIKLFDGKPIIQYSIEAAESTLLFDEIMVSTEDREIAALASTLSAQTPFFRSQDNADDYSTLTDVLLEVITAYEKMGRHFDNVCLILPTAPFITGDILAGAYEKLKTSPSLSAIIPVVRYSHPIQRAFHLKEEQFLEMIWPENKFIRSQDLPASFHDSGQFYWIRTKNFLEEKAIFMKQVGAFILDEKYIQDIDTEEDWNIAEIKYQILKEKRNEA